MGDLYQARIEISFIEHDDEDKFTQELRDRLKTLTKDFDVAFNIYWDDLEGHARPKIDYPEKIS